MKKFITGAAAVVAAMIASSTSNAASFQPLGNTGDGIYMAGEIVAGDYEKFVKLYNSQARKGVRVLGVILNSAGGSVIEGVQLAVFVKQKNLIAMIAPKEECVSICVTILAAARARYVSKSAQIGVHSVAMYRNGSRGGVENNDSLALSIKLGRLMASFGAPDKIISKMMLTKHGEVYWATAEDTQGWTQSLPGESTEKSDAFANTTEAKNFKSPTRPQQIDAVVKRGGAKWAHKRMRNEFSAGESRGYVAVGSLSSSRAAILTNFDRRESGVQQQCGLRPETGMIECRLHEANGAFAVFRKLRDMWRVQPPHLAGKTFWRS